MSLISRWPLIVNSNDAVDGNNGVNTAVTFGGGAAIFNGSAQLNCGAPSNLNFGTGTFTLCAWVKNIGSSLERKTILARLLNTTSGGYFIDMRPSGALVCFFGTDGANRLFQDSSTLINDGNEHFIAFVRTGSTTANVYIDGVLSNGTTTLQGTPGNVNSTDNFYIGRQSDNGAEPSFSVNWKGTIREARAYNNALNGSEILTLMNETRRKANFLPFFYQ